jgi:DNA-binding response OmpR family regulator
MLTILMIEDFEILRDATVRLFESHGHRAIGVDCAEALDEELGGRHFDVFVLDLNLPGEDGLSLAQRIRATHPLAGIVMMTARTNPQDAAKGYAGGADIYLPKPVDATVLLAAVESLGRRVHAAPQSAVGRASVFLDSATRLLKGERGEVRLTEDELLLITALARARGAQLDSWQLMVALGLDPETYSKSSLEIRIVRLRRKLLDVGAGAGCLRAVRGKGYWLSEPIEIV